jgi:class 3 adenylate cyclase/tetratricopeptide (TPR) repeat protein
MTCDACGTNAPVGARFCPNCGATLSREARGGPRVRKTVTMLFVDVTGSTALGERLDAESMRGVIDRYFDAAADVLRRHGGTLEKYIGDAVMAVFGVPQLHEDDALRAVRAALELRERLETLNVELGERWGVELQTRTGIDTGEVVTAELPGPDSFVTGDAANVAARLEQSAAPGEILIGAATHDLVRDAVIAEPAGPLPLKGRQVPADAWRVHGLRPAAEMVARRTDVPMVGRDAELAQLSGALLRCVSDRRCHLATVLGEPGIGKSRLAAELMDHARRDGLRVLSGRCLPYGEGITFFPLSEIISGLGEGDVAEVVRAAVGEEPDADEIVTLVTGLVGRRTAPDNDQPFWAVRRLMECLAREAPLLLVVDDLHWAEPTLLDLVEALARGLRASPVTIVGTARAELLDDRPGWGGGLPNTTSILLSPLTEDACLELVRMLADDGGSEPDLGLMAREAAGNPLFLEQLAALRRESAAGVPDLRQAPSVQALVAARLDALGAVERAVAERAAVVGEEFSPGAVAHLCEGDMRDAVARALDLLASRDLVRPAADGRSYRFRHIVVAECAYARLPKLLRAELHERFAEWMEHQDDDRMVELDHILGYHLEQACRYRTELGQPLDPGLAHRAGLALVESGRRAAARNDNGAARNLLRRAVQVLPGDDELILDAAIELGAAQFRAGDSERAAATLEGSRAAAERRGDVRRQTHAELHQATLEWVTQGRSEPLAIVADRAVQVFTGFDDHAGLAHAYRRVGDACGAVCRYDDARAAYELALSHARTAGDLPDSHVAGNLALVLWIGPTPVDTALERCNSLLAEVPSQATRAAAALPMAGLEAMRGRPDAAHGLLELVTVFLRERHSSVALAELECWAGVIELSAGDLDRAEQRFRAGLDGLMATGTANLASLCAARLAHVLCEQGRTAEAAQLAEQARRTADPEQVDTAVLWRTAAARAQSSPDGAQALAREAVDLAESTDSPQLVAEALVDLAWVLGAGHDETAALLDRSLTLSRGKGDLVSVRRTSELLSMLSVEATL